MKLCLINDIHIAGARSDSDIIAQHQRKFFETVMFPYIKDNGIDEIFILGDVFERRKYVNFKSFDYALDSLFRPAQRLGLPVRILLGNHDVFYRNTNDLDAPTLLLSQFNNVTIYKTNTEIEIGGCHIAVCPWIADSKQATEEFTTFINNTRSSVVFGHFDIVGFEMMDGLQCDFGLSQKTFERFEMVLTGHYHNKSTKNNIVYLGTQYDMDWNDYGHDKFFHIFDTETRQVTPVLNPHKIFVKFIYDDGLPTSVPDLTGRYVKVLVTKKSNPYDFEKVCDKIRAKLPEYFQCIDLTHSVSEKEEPDSGQAQEKSIKDLIKQSVDNIQHQDAELKQRVLTFMSGIYEEAKVLSESKI